MRSNAIGAARPLPARMLVRFAALFSALLGIVAASAQDAAPAQPRAIPAARQANHVAVISIEGPIDHITVYSVKRRLRVAESIGADAIVFELNTPGGAVGATLEICNLIKNSSIPNTVAWINTDAYSAGTFIALACREIVTAQYATMGDAAPVMGIPGVGMMSMPETERQKQLSPLISELVDSARRHGYDEMLVQAFVTLGVELWLVEDVQTGDRLFVTEAEYRMLFQGDPPRSSPRMASAPGSPAPASPDAPPRRIAQTQADGDDPDIRRFRPAGEAIGADEITKIVNETLDAPSHRPILTTADRGRFRLVEYATDGRTLLTLKSEDLQRYGFAAQVVRSDEELKAFFGATTITRLDRNWSEAMVVLLSNMWVRGVLIVVFLIAMFMEMAAPGMGIPGGIAGLCLLGLLAPPLLIGAAAWWTVLAVFGGIALILVELFVLPGLTVFGVGGVLLLFAGLIGSFVGADPSRTSQEVAYGVAIVLSAFFVAGFGMYFVSRFYGTLPIFDKLILTGHASEDDDDAPAPLTTPAADVAAPVRVGDEGEAVTSLRPSGAASFGDRLVDVVSDTGFIDMGERVRVIDVTRYRVAVERAERGEAGEGSA